MMTSKQEPLYGIVPAAGVGSRMKSAIPKQYLILNGKTVLEHTVEKLLSHPRIDKVLIAISDGDKYFPELPLSEDNRIIRVPGGEERADSVLSGLNYLCDEMVLGESRVLVHDAARPCVALSDIDRLIEEAESCEAGGILASPVRDTMKRGNQDSEIESTVDRSHLWHALTPQMFPALSLRNALVEALKAGASITDEASAMEWKGVSPRLIAGRADNLKITQPEDLALAEFYLRREKQVKEEKNIKEHK